MGKHLGSKSRIIERINKKSPSPKAQLHPINRYYPQKHNLGWLALSFLKNFYTKALAIIIDTTPINSSDHNDALLKVGEPDLLCCCSGLKEVGKEVLLGKCTGAFVKCLRRALPFEKEELQ